MSGKGQARAENGNAQAKGEIGKGRGRDAQGNTLCGSNVCIRLDADCRYFYKDCLEKWFPGGGLIYLAQRAVSCDTFVRGKDEPVGNLPSTLLSKLAHAKCLVVQSMFFFVEGVSDADSRILEAMEQLRFRTGGSITVLKLSDTLHSAVASAPLASRGSTKYIKSPDGSVMLSLEEAYMHHVLHKRPTWRLDSLFIIHVSVYLIHIDADRQVYVFALWDSMRQKWGVPGGGVKHRSDRDILDAAQREWNEEVCGYPWAGVVDTAKEQLVLTEKMNGLHSFGGACHIVARANPGFVRALSVDGYHRLPAPEGQSVLRWGSKDLHRLHTDEDTVFVEHDDASWIKVSPDGMLTACQGVVQRSNFRMFRHRDSRLWAYLGFPVDPSLHQNDHATEIMVFPAEFRDLLMKRKGPIAAEVGAAIEVGKHCDNNSFLVHVSGGPAEVDDGLDKLEQLVDWAMRKKGMKEYSKPK